MRRLRAQGASFSPGSMEKRQVFMPGVKLPPVVQQINQNTPPGFGRNQIAAFNKDTQQIQSYRVSVNQGNTDLTPVLDASGIFLKGLAISANSFASLSDTSLTFSVNNRNVLVQASVLLFIPNYTQGLLYYPIPQPLTGKDTFKVQFQKNDAGTVITYLSLVYIPAF